MRLPSPYRVHFKFSQSLTGIGEVGFSQMNDFLPLLVHGNDSEVEHVLCAFFAPALAGEFHSFLHYGAVGGFNGTEPMMPQPIVL